MYRFAWEQVRESGLELTGSESSTAYPELADMQRESGCRFVAPIDVDVRVYPVNGMLEVAGSIHTRLALDCSRCLAGYEQDLHVDLQLTLVRELPRIESEDGEELELSAEEMGMIQIDQDEVDLRPFVAEQILLEMPWRPLCSRSCAGLCPSCGANLNVETCGCHPETGFSKFAALKDFKVKK